MSKKPEKPDSGLEFPRDASGKRSTSEAGCKVIAHAIGACKLEKAKQLSDACANEKKWRFKYQKHLLEMVKLSCYSSEAALDIAKAGIEYMHQNFEFVDPVTKSSSSFKDYMSTPFLGDAFHIGEVQGSKPVPESIRVPYKGKELSGDELSRQLNKWATYGTIEPDAASSINGVVKEMPDLSRDMFVLIGAGSAMGPFIKLLEHGATIVAIDIARDGMWAKLVATTKNSSGRMLVPLNKPQAGLSDDEFNKSAGCNLMEQPKQILRFILDCVNNLKPASITIGNYTYLDGDLHVKLALAADAVIAGVCQQHKHANVAFLCTPTDLHIIPEEANKAAKKNHSWHVGKMLEVAINLLSMGKKLKKNAMKPVDTEIATKKLFLVDGLSVAQGPNYALAKRLQHWRAMVEFEAGHRVSSNVAPSTATISVVSNRTFAWAYGGMPYFKPYEIFQQETTNAVMTAMLISDVKAKDSAADPSNRKKYNINNPIELFRTNSVHGGVWRAAYTVDSIGETSVIIHFLGGPKLFLPVVALIFGLIAYFILEKFSK